MLIRAFALNSNNKIELSLLELQSLLNAAYEEGAERERNKKVFHWDYPFITCNTNTSVNKDTVTLNSIPNNISDKTQQVTNSTLPDGSAYTFAVQGSTTCCNVINGAINNE